MNNNVYICSLKKKKFFFQISKVIFPSILLKPDSIMLSKDGKICDCETYEVDHWSACTWTCGS